MKKFLFFAIAFFFVVSCGVLNKKEVKKMENPHVIIKTNMGDIEVELFKDKAPLTVENFLRYVNEHFYDGTIFHRVIPGFVIQAGGITSDMQQKETHEPVKNEAGNGLLNLRGTLSMARTNVVDSGTSHFFINLVDNKRLDHKDDTPAGYGYCVFGKVVKGMDVVDKIAQVKTHNVGMFRDVPEKDVIIETIILEK